MAKAKDLQQYPEEYQKIIEQVGVEGKTIMIPFDNGTQAASMRGHFYAFIGALKDHYTKWEPRTKTERLTDGTLELMDRYKQSRMVYLTIEKLDGKPHLVFQNREKSWQAQKVRQAIIIDPHESAAARTNPVSRAGLPTAERELSIEEQIELIKHIDPRTGRLKEDKE